MSAALALHKAREYVRAAIRAHGSDVDLAAAERVLTEELEQFTPVQPVSARDVRAAHESSSKFKAVDVTRIFDPAKMPQKRGI